MGRRFVGQTRLGQTNGPIRVIKHFFKDNVAHVRVRTQGKRHGTHVASIVRARSLVPVIKVFGETRVGKEVGSIHHAMDTQVKFVRCGIS